MGSTFVVPCIFEGGLQGPGYTQPEQLNEALGAIPARPGTGCEDRIATSAASAKGRCTLQGYFPQPRAQWCPFFAASVFWMPFVRIEGFWAIPNGGQGKDGQAGHADQEVVPQRTGGISTSTLNDICAKDRIS